MIFFSFCGARKQHRYSLFSLSNLRFWPKELGGYFRNVDFGFRAIQPPIQQARQPASQPANELGHDVL